VAGGRAQAPLLDLGGRGLDGAGQLPQAGREGLALGVNRRADAGDVAPLAMVRRSMAWTNLCRCGCAASGSGSGRREEVKQSVIREETETRKYYPFIPEALLDPLEGRVHCPEVLAMARVRAGRNADESSLLFASSWTFCRRPVIGPPLEHPVPDISRAGDFAHVHPPAQELRASSQSRGGGTRPPARVRRAAMCPVGCATT
jgi:hypothetical protein